jgi:citronellol/citronellal dehydrogenase
MSCSALRAQQLSLEATSFPRWWRLGKMLATKQSETSAKAPVAIITGASRGIGREIALTLAERDKMVLVLAAKSQVSRPNLPGTVESVARECLALGATDVLPILLDVRDGEGVERMVRETLRRFGRIDLLVCNAGALWWKPVKDTPLSRFDLVHGVNARGAFACARAVLPTMIRQGSGLILTMSPPVELDALPGMTGYMMSKFGMTMLVHGLGGELSGTGVAAVALWPATMVESFATKNFQLGERSQWRKASVVADCVHLLYHDPQRCALSGQALIDEEYMRSRGIHDFTQYRCDPNVEPERAWPPQKPWTTTARDPKQVPPGVSAVPSKL